MSGVRNTFMQALTVCLAGLADAVGSETHYPHIAQDIVRRCSNNTISVGRYRFCGDMARCILSSIDNTVSSNLQAGSSMMSLVPTAVVLIASTMEDVVTIVRRDPWFGFLVAFASGGAQGLVRSGRISEVDAGSWWADDQEVIQHSTNAVVVPGYMQMPGERQNPDVKDSFIRQELQLLYKKVSDTQSVSPGWLLGISLLGWFLRLSSAGATAAVIWLYTVRQDTSYCAWDCPRRQYLALLFGFMPPLLQYLLTPALEYREYWVLEHGSDAESLELYNGENRESGSLACYVYGTPPASARGALKGTSRDRKRSISFFSKYDTPVDQPGESQNSATVRFDLEG